MYAVIACFPLGLRRVGLRVLDQREVHPLDFPAILAPERIDSLPLAVVGAQTAWLMIAGGKRCRK